jgi:hypothetical protein
MNLHRTILATALILLAPPAGAHAMTDEERLAAYTPIAEAAWTQGPCAGKVRVELHSTADMGGDAVAIATPAECRIVFKEDPRRTDGYFCRELVHEYGHLAGFGHVDGPFIMNHLSRFQPFPGCDGAPVERHAPSEWVVAWQAYEASVRAEEEASLPRKYCRSGKRMMWGRCR